MPKFSIIIPVYNVAPYLRECLDSILAQTFTDWEAICVDDGSTDGSGAILDAYAKQDERIRVFHVKNGGVSVARNTGLQLARGEVIGFIDGDDVVVVNWLERAEEVMRTCSADFVRLGFALWDGAANKCDMGSGRCMALEKRGCLLKWGWDNLLAPSGGGLWQYFIRSEVVLGNKIEMPVGMRMAEDRIFDLKCLQYVGKAVECDFRGYLYRKRSGSACYSRKFARDSERFMIELRDVYFAQKAVLEQHNLSGHIRKLVTKSIIGDLLNTIEFGALRELMSNRKIPCLMRDLHRQGLLVRSEIPRRWRWAVLLSMTVGLTFPVVIEQLLIYVYRFLAGRKYVIVRAEKI